MDDETKVAEDIAEILRAFAQEMEDEEDETEEGICRKNVSLNTDSQKIASD
jgi:hypothetical protein